MPDGQEGGGPELQGEEFVLLDVDGSGGGAPASPARPAPGTAVEGEPSKLSRVAFTGANVLISCSALAVAKQILNPSTWGVGEAAAAQEASKELPSWFANQYARRRIAAAVTRGVAKDTGVLVVASGLWYGLQMGLEQLRGTQDAFNVCLAGTASASFLGAAFFEPFKLSRAGIWGAVGGMAGYFGYREQQALRAALLERQQRLEHKHLHVEPGSVHQQLDTRLLKQLLELEHKEQEALRANKRAAQSPEAGRDSSSGGGAAGSGGDTASTVQLPEWSQLMSSAPWLSEEQPSNGGGSSSDP